MRQGLEYNFENFGGDSRKAFIYPLTIQRLKVIKIKL
jgi:hypothetical protein